MVAQFLAILCISGVKRLDRLGCIVGLALHCHLEATFGMASGLTTVVGHAEAVL